MRKQSTLLLLLSTLILFSWGCGQSEQSAAPPSPPPAPAPGTTPPAPPPQAGTPTGTPVAATATQPSADLKTFGLIPATNPQQRQQQIAVGRSNPFALIAIQPKVEPGITVIKKPPPKPNVSNQQAKGAKTKNTTLKTTTAKQNKDSSKVAQISNQKSGNSAKKMPSHTIAKSLPPEPPPSPTEAKAVEISGVIAIGSTPFAIIQAPGESVPRYVSPGDMVANGQVRIVSINNNAETPTVTLEQYGQQVIREVGTPPEGSVITAPPGSAPLQPTAS